eukprot:Rmarinus@m.26526
MDEYVGVVACSTEQGRASQSEFVSNVVSISGKGASVMVLDVDVGQSEFAPPSLISLVQCTSPLLSPPFAHIHTPVLSHCVGAASPKDDPLLYKASVHATATEYFRSPVYKQLPLLVNTLGWVQGMGLSSLHATITAVRPTHIVETTLSSTSDRAQTATALLRRTITNALAECNAPCKDILTVAPFAQLQSIPPPTVFYSPSAAHDMRALMLLAYLSRSLSPSQPTFGILGSDTDHDFGSSTPTSVGWWGVHPPIQVLPNGRVTAPSSLTEVAAAISKITPLAVAFDSVDVQFLFESIPKKDGLFALNATIVALCECTSVNFDFGNASEHGQGSLMSSVPVYPCFGIALVRAATTHGVGDRPMLFLTTPEQPKRVSQSNVIVRGNIGVPQVVLSLNDAGGPYATTTALSREGVGEKKMKSRQNIQRK